MSALAAVLARASMRCRAGVPHAHALRCRRQGKPQADAADPIRVRRGNRQSGKTRSAYILPCNQAHPCRGCPSAATTGTGLRRCPGQLQVPKRAVQVPASNVGRQRMSARWETRRTRIRCRWDRFTSYKYTLRSAKVNPTTRRNCILNRTRLSVSASLYRQAITAD